MFLNEQIIHLLGQLCLEFPVSLSFILSHSLQGEADF